MQKIKVLWLSNVPPIPLSDDTTITGGGWLSGALNSIRLNPSIELILSFPLADDEIKEQGETEGISYYGFHIAGYPKLQQLKPIHRRILHRKLSDILKTVNPDILHIFGTEFLHSHIALECFKKPAHSIIHIQGLVSVYAHHALLGLPFRAKNLFVPSSLLYGTPRKQARIWRSAGKEERRAIQGVNNIAGRTEWDEACTMQINPNARYFHCGETLRTVFYDDSSRWNLSDCQQHSIYYSQGFDQVKGLHLVLPILKELIRRFPDVHLFVGGPSPIKAGFLKRRSYGFYIARLIKKHGLSDYVTFLGPQNAEQVVENLKRSHVFLSSSLIENSPNAVGEALIVGVPTVSSDVGGVKNFIEHGRSGFVYPVDEPYMIPYYVGKIFENPEVALQFSNQGRQSAIKAYDPVKNGADLVAIYDSIIKDI